MGMVINSYALGAAIPSGPAVSDYAYTGSAETYSVPSGYSYATVILWGAGGGAGSYNGGASANAGPGGVLIATFPVASGDTLSVEVGQGGRGGNTAVGGGAGGWPDGGGGSFGDVFGGGGGGSTRFYRNSALKAVAGAGGGQGWSQAYGGPGGGTTGGTAQQGHAGGNSTTGGSGGSQIAGGVDLNDSTNANKKGRSIVSFPGAQRTGGWGGSTGNITTSTSDDGGAGGGGYWGGGGGGGDGDSGGGGSSWTDTDATGTTHWQSGMFAPAFLPEGYSGVGRGPYHAYGGAALNGGDGHARIILHNGAEGFGVLGLTSCFNANAGITLAANNKVRNPIAVPSGGVWVREIQVMLSPTSNGGTFLAGAKLKGIIYDSPGGLGFAQATDALIATTAEYTVVSGDQGNLVRLAFAAPLFLAAGNYWFGVITDSAHTIHAVGGGNYIGNVDTYSDGATATFGALTFNGTNTMRLVMPYSVNDPS